jgi:hypothetical protein
VLVLILLRNQIDPRMIFVDCFCVAFWIERGRVVVVVGGVAASGALVVLMKGRPM